MHERQLQGDAAGDAENKSMISAAAGATLILAAVAVWLRWSMGERTLQARTRDRLR